MPFETFISVNDLVRLQQSGVNLHLFDCRFDLKSPEAGYQAWCESHISNAVYANLDHDLSLPDPSGVGGRHPLPDREQFADWIAAQGVNQHDQVIVYDAVGGAFAARLWWMLRWLGHSEVAILDGGFPAWIEDENPVFSFEQETQSEAVKGDFKPLSPLVETLDLSDLERNLETQQWQVIDARTLDRFTGENEPFGPVAGHIPGSWCAPFNASLNEGGRLKSVETLVNRFVDLQGRDNLVCSCGSGVTACHNIAAMMHVGLAAPRLFVGSWSEWSRDTQSRPTASGQEASQPTSLLQ